MKQLIQDIKGSKVQVFAPSKIVAVTATVAWTPTMGDIAFCSPVDNTYTINGAGDAATIGAGSIRGIRRSTTYTFSVSCNIEVM